MYKFILLALFLVPFVSQAEILPQFSVDKNGSNQTVSSGVETTVTWSRENFDTNNNFSANTFTPTVAGRYLITAQVYCSNATTDCEIKLNKNGTAIARSFIYTTSSTNTGIPNIAVVVDMNGSTDYLDVSAIAAGGTTINGNAAFSFFTGAMLPSVATSTETTFASTTIAVDNPAINIATGLLIFACFMYFTIWFFSKRK